MNILRFKYIDPTLTADDKALLAPAQKTAWASGFDLACAQKDNITLYPGQRLLVSTGIAISLDPGFEGQVRSRSGLALKNGVVVLNAPGTIDADYRGEIKVILGNLSEEPFQICFAMRIAQLVLASVITPRMTEVDALDESERGERGFGSTGLVA